MVPTCPRCGYDQSGAIASWDTRAPASCPLHGTCSECGLTFWWHDVIHADRLIVRGFVEHARGFWQTWRWAWVTWAWTLWPPVFWRRVRMEHTPQVKWCLAWFFVLVIPGHVLTWASAIAFLASKAVNGTLVFNAPSITWVMAGALSALEPIVTADVSVNLKSIARPSVLEVNWLDFGIIPAVPAMAAMTVMSAVALVVLPATRSIARVRMSHVARLTMYGLSWLVVPWSLVLLWRASFFLAFAIRWASGSSNRTAPGFLDWPARAIGVQMDFWPVPLIVSLAWFCLWWRRGIREVFRNGPHAQVCWVTLLVGALTACATILWWPTTRFGMFRILYGD